MPGAPPFPSGSWSVLELQVAVASRRAYRLSGTEWLTLKWLIFCLVNFTSIFKMLL